MYRRLVSACESDARDCASCALAWSTAARAERAVATALSRSVSEMSRCAKTSSARFAWRSASSAVTLRRVTLALRGHDVGLRLHDRSLEQRRIDLRDPFALLHHAELKSAYRSRMRPDTWLPTSTVTTACRLPDVLTRETTLPRSIDDGLVFGFVLTAGGAAIQDEQALMRISATSHSRRARESCLSKVVSDLIEWEMGTFLISRRCRQKGTYLFEVRPLLLGNEECPHFPHKCRSVEGTRVPLKTF